MNISEKDLQMLWGVDEPYSEAKIVMNTRILGDKVSHVMLEVEGNINPTTFKLIKKNKYLFADNPMIMELLETARYFGKGNGYVISAVEEELTDDPAVMERAKEKLRYMKDSLIIMHTFVMEYFDL